jgi:hypothetical protein
MQYTLRNIPAYLDELVRKRAKEENKSLNEVALDALKRAFGLATEAIKYRDLSDVAGTWKADPDFDDAISKQREIDPDLWR